MRKAAFLFCCSLIAPIVGCGKTLEEPVEPERATEVFTSTLESWKKGERFEGLKQRQPPIYFNEKEWESGKKLLKYEVGPVTLMGRQGRCTVKLTLQDSAGTVTERAIGYQIDTTPTIVITREGLGP